MEIKRRYAISIISAAGLVGLRKFFLSPTGLSDAAQVAHDVDFGMQLIPIKGIPGLTQPFNQFLDSIKKSKVSVVSYEDRWGGSDQRHPLRHWKDWVGVIAYYLLFPTNYQEVKRLIHKIYEYHPNALPIDTGPLAAQEISPNNNPDPKYWVDAASNGDPLVVDTYHLHHGWSEGGGSDLLEHLLINNPRIVALQIQFRDEVELETFVNIRNGVGGCSKTFETLQKLSQHLPKDTPVIIELPPNLVTLGRLMKIRFLSEEVFC